MWINRNFPINITISLELPYILETPIFQFKPPFWVDFPAISVIFVKPRMLLCRTPLHAKRQARILLPGGRSNRWPFENVARPVMHCDAWCDLVFFLVYHIAEQNGAHLYYHIYHQTYPSRSLGGIEATKMPQCVLKHRSRTIGPGQNETDHCRSLRCWDAASNTSRGDAETATMVFDAEHGDLSWFKNGLTMVNNGMIWDLPSGKLRVCELEHGPVEIADLPIDSMVIFWIFQFVM